MTAEKENTLDNKTFELLFNEHFKGLCFYAVKFVKDVEIAKEIVQDSFVAIWEKQNSIDLNKSIKSYLVSIVHNKCLNYLRDNKKFNKDILIVENLENESNYNPNDYLIEKDLSAALNKAIEDLPERCKEIFILNRHDNLKYKEISEKLGISIKTVESNISKALTHLRNKLSDFLIIFLIIFLFLLKI